jgi:hypothetical protein
VNGEWYLSFNLGMDVMDTDNHCTYRTYFSWYDIPKWVKEHKKRTQFRVEICANKVWKNVNALVIGGCVCKNFSIISQPFYQDTNLRCAIEHLGYVCSLPYPEIRYCT